MDLELHRGPPPTQSRLGDQSARPPLVSARDACARPHPPLLPMLQLPRAREYALKSVMAEAASHSWGTPASLLADSPE